MNKKILFAALFLAALSIGFTACDNDDDPRLDNDDDNVENVNDDYYSCDSTEMVCTGKAYDITTMTAKVATTVHIPLTLLAQCQLGVQVSSSKENLMAHENVTNFTTKNLTGNDFVVNISGITFATTYYYCAYIYLNGVYHYGIIREFTTLASFPGEEMGHCYVDLGLPSGTKWATCNVGATAPEKYGNYYAWGETKPKSWYEWGTYKWCNGSSSTLTKYCNKASYGKDSFTDDKTVLELADDAARANWGGAWRMPTDAEWTELRTKCTWTWIENYKETGIKGYEVKGTNGNSIFLPAAGFRSNDDFYSAGDGLYWSSSLNTVDPRHAWGVYFDSDGVYRYGDDRYCGQSVRPVLGE